MNSIPFQFNTPLCEFNRGFFCGWFCQLLKNVKVLLKRQNGIDN